MSRQPDLTYQPPISDPRDDGVKHWDTIRKELMLTRDALALSEGDLGAANRRIKELESDKEKLSADREADRNECVTLRAQVQAGADFFLNILRAGQQSRGPEAYKPKTHREVIDGQVKEIENMLSGEAPLFLKAEHLTQPHTTEQ